MTKTTWTGVLVVWAACGLPLALDDTTESAKKIDHSIAEECATPKARAVFTATAADISASGLKGSAGEDSRTSALEADFSFGCGANESSEYATSQVKATLRSAEGHVVEEWLLNDARPSHTLNDWGCNVKQAFPQCWRFVPDDLDETGCLHATLPTWSDEAAALLDPEGTRPTVSGDVDLLLGNLLSDPVSGRATFRWHAPFGLDLARIQLRLDVAKSDDSGLVVQNFALYRERWYGDGPDVVSPFVQVVERSEHDLVLSVDVRALTDGLGTLQDDDGCILPTRSLQIEGETARWTFENQGQAVATMNNVQVTWPESLGNLTVVRVDGVVLWQGVREPPTATVSDGWEKLGEQRTVDPGEAVTLEVVFDGASTSGWNPADLSIDVGFVEGCTTRITAASRARGM